MPRWSARRAVKCDMRRRQCRIAITCDTRVVWERSILGQSALGARTAEDGSATVRLRNPWGIFEPGQAAGDGIFEYPFESFLRQFNYVTLGLPRDVAK